jgi:hypothetical protein
MKTFRNLFILGLFLGGFPLLVTAKLGGDNNKNIVGKFFVSNVKGTVTCVIDSRIMELKKGDTFPARGAIIDTAAHANATLVFSNGTGVYTDEKTHFEIKRFEQEFFAPNNNLRVEPSNSLTMVRLDFGRVVLSTPQLLSGTIMLYETPHALVNVRGDKVLIEVNDKQTLSHIALVAGNVSVVPRGADGEFLSIGKRLTTGQEAFVKYALHSDGHSRADVADHASAVKKPAIQSVAEAQAGTAASTGYIGPNKTPGTAKAAPNAPAVTTETRAKVVKIIGIVKGLPPVGSAETVLKEGDLLPMGTTIMTEAGSELYLETFKGAIANLRPSSTMAIEKLSVTTVQEVVKKQTSVLFLKAGTVVSTIDPATKEINDYGVRSPKGLAHASGTSFTVTVDDDNFSVATTADAVLFTPLDGPAYLVTAGNVIVIPPGGQAQPPISLFQAIANNPGFATVLQDAVKAVVYIVQNNIGAMNADSAAMLMAQVIKIASDAFPAQADNFAAQSLAALSGYSSSTSGGNTGAGGTVTGAAAAANDKATSVIVTQFDPSSLGAAIAGLQAAQTGQSSVQFDTDKSGSDITVLPTPTVPNTLPIENTTSPAMIPGG